MSIRMSIKNQEIGVGDRVRVYQKIQESDKFRTQIFDGIVISIKGRDENASFTVRRIGESQIGIEKIFPLTLPTIEKIEVVRQGKKGVKRAKLYYIRNKSKKEIERIFSRVTKKVRNNVKSAKVDKKNDKTTSRTKRRKPGRENTSR